METQKQINFNRIAQAIEYIHANFKQQPTLDEVAENIHLSPTHFQRMFTEWAGTSPKKFLQYVSIEYAKKLLSDKQISLLETSEETGLSSTSRLHELFVNIEGMTPGEFKNGGKNLYIHYSFADSQFGKLIVASTHKGICYLAFEADKTTAFHHLKSKFPRASFHEKLDKLQQNALFLFQKDWDKLCEVKLHLKGTDFQLKVWQGLLQIPFGSLSTYGNLAKSIHNSKAYRAVGTAISNNPVAYIIPCHRVIRANGNFGNYRWGNTRKKAMIGWEAVNK